MNVDVLAVGAHPDDIELGLGGTLARLATEGLRVGLLDLTRGELSTRGTVDMRMAEAAEAARILGAARRENAGLPDGALANTHDQRVIVAQWIRAFAPRALFLPMTPDRHPDHRAAHDLVRDANFFAGLPHYPASGAPHRAAQVYYYHGYYTPEATPPLVADISESFARKRDAIGAYRSQFYHPDTPGDAPQTYISTEAFWEDIEVRARFWGGRIGVRYGEPIFCTLPIPFDLQTLLNRERTGH